MARLSWAVLGGDPAPGEPGAFDQLARSFAATAANAGDAHATLSRLAAAVDDSVWSGEAADAFRDKIGELPPRLAKLHDSYQAASEGMAGYARSLRDLQARAEALLAQARCAQDDQDTATRCRDQAQTQDPTASTVGYDQAIADAARRLRGVSGQIADLRERRHASENTAVGKLEQAQDLGLANDPWYKRAWDAVDRWVDEHADFLQGLSSILKTVAGIAGVLSLIPLLAPICAPIALGLALAALTLDAALAATGNGDWKTLLLDAALVAVPGGKLLSLRRFRPQAVAGKIPKSWGRGKPNRKGKGWRWNDGNPARNSVRVDKGDPKASHPSQRVDHVRVNSGGRPLKRDGEPLPNGVRVKDDPVNTHIPLSEYKKWRKWNEP